MLSVYFVTSLFALHIYGAKVIQVFLVIQKFSYDSYNNVRIQARLDVVFEDAYVDILDPQYFDPNNTVLFVEPNDEGINTLNSIITVVKLFDLEATVSLFYLILFCHHYLYIGSLIFRRMVI